MTVWIADNKSVTQMPVNGPIFISISKADNFVNYQDKKESQNPLASQNHEKTTKNISF